MSGFVRIKRPLPRNMQALAGSPVSASPGVWASQRFIFILAPTARCPASPALGQPAQESNLVPFSILEALLRIKNRSNDGKESERTAALSLPSCQGLNESPGSFREMRDAFPSRSDAWPRNGESRQGLVAPWGGPVSAAPTDCLCRHTHNGILIGQVPDETLRTVTIGTYDNLGCS